jgi:L-alanine-DL-glutamate epimerase-like enolase superfamily enzyme
LGDVVTVVTEIETYYCELPRRREWTQHGIPQTLDRRVVLSLETDEGTKGWGEATALPQWGGLGGVYYGETRETVTSVIHDFLAPLLLGEDPMEMPQLTTAFDFAIRGHPYAKATVEMALQDLRGKLLGAPIYQLLGGRVRDRIRIAHMLTMMPNEDALAEAQAIREADGITAFQIKVGVDIDRDVDLVEALRSALGDDVALRVDANRGYGRQPLVVAKACQRLEAAGVDAIEQPADSVEAMATAQARVTVPIVADEACWTSSDVLELWQAGAASAVSVYVAKAGGIRPAALVAATADIVGMASDLNGSLESGIGAAASMHVALASSGTTNPSIIPVPGTKEKPLTELAGRYWEDGIVSSGFTWDDGYLLLGDAPGLGIEVDEDRLVHYAGGNQRKAHIE